MTGTSGPGANGEALRRWMRDYPQGVVVVTADAGEGPRGITVSSFTSVSLTPPLVLIAISHSSASFGIIERAARFAVNVLSDEQGALSEHFARPELSSDEQFRSLPSRPGRVGAPWIEGCLAYLDCRIVHSTKQSDHTIFIGRVEAVEINSQGGRPLLYYSGDYWTLGSVVYARRR